MVRAPYWLAVVGLALAAPRVASADDRDRKLSDYESEVSKMSANLPPIGSNATSTNPARRLVEAEVAFSLGDYDSATTMLFDLVDRPGPEQEPARYYLAESLYQRHELGAARRSYQAIIDSRNFASRYYQPSLLRIIEISIAQNDLQDIDVQLSALGGLGAGQTPEATYVRGKLAYAQGKFDEAIGLFGQVPAGSPQELQAKYYAAVTNVAKKDVAAATDQFTALTTAKPKSSADRRVIELSQLALGRLYYERDQLVKSLDAYLLVDRQSDLFPDALYEVAWVYVKTKQYDKALGALELLALARPTSTTVPTVRILEGNLRIRKAQMLRQAIIDGTVRVDQDPATTPETEYFKASNVFIDTHAAYNPAFLRLGEIIDGNEDVSQYLAQLAGKTPELFTVTAPMPEAAAQYLVEEPDVQRAVRVEADLDEVRTTLDESQQTLVRLQALVASGDRTAVYPQLQARRTRIGQVLDDLNVIRGQLADKEVAALGGAGSLGGLTASRRALQQQYAATGGVEGSFSTLKRTMDDQYNQLDAGIGEVRGGLDTSQAMATAIRTYAKSTSQSTSTALSAEQTTAVNDLLATTSSEAAAITAELGDMEREVQLGRDLALVGDPQLAQTREVRRQLLAALAAEQQGLGGAGASGKVADQAARASRLADQLVTLEGVLDAAADRGLAESKIEIDQLNSLIAGYRVELAEHEAGTRELSTTSLAASFKTVRDKLGDIVVRTDVGEIDVAWAQKEDSDDDLKRLNLSRQREMKQLHDEFKDILEGGVPAPGQPVAPAPGTETPTPTSTPATPTGSPDQGTGSRVAPTVPGKLPGTAPTPTVKPGTQTGTK